MARSMADDYQDTYRARIVWKPRKHNPDYAWGDDENPRWIDDPEASEVVTCYGPYSTKGVAKAQMHLGSRAQVISAKVQKASITWEDVSD